MSQRRGSVARIVMLAVLGAALLPTGAAWAGNAGEVQDLKREVSRLRAEIQALQVALADASELQRQRSDRLSKALDAQAAPAEPPAQPAEAPGANAEPAAPKPPAVAAPAAGKTKSAPQHRHHRRSRRSR